MKLIKWHKDMLEKVRTRLRLSNYAVVWIAFGKGLGIGYLLSSL